MSVIKNIAAFRNWPLFYAARYGFLHGEFEIIHRSGIRIRLRSHTDDLKTVKSNFVTKHYWRDFLPITKDSIVVDLGAHIGSFTLMAAQIASKVLAVEPVPSNYRLLKTNIELNGLKNTVLYQMAVSGVSGFQEICIWEGAATGTHSLYLEGSGSKKRVQTISLEDLMKKENLSVIDFLKVDCEGAEHDIFRTISRETASKIKRIAMETHGIRAEFSIDLPLRLSELGFEVRVEERGAYVYARRVPGA